MEYSFYLSDTSSSAVLIYDTRPSDEVDLDEALHLCALDGASSGGGFFSAALNAVWFSFVRLDVRFVWPSPIFVLIILVLWRVIIGELFRFYVI